MKRLLVVSDPPVAPGFLPRLRHLCEYLVQKGVDVTVLTEEAQPLTFAHSYPIETIRMYSGGTFDWFVKTVWSLLTDWHDRVFAKRFLTAQRSNSDSGLTSHSAAVYDAVLCTTFNYFPLGAAQRIAKALNVPLICDVRDLEEQVDDSTYQYRHQAWYTMPFRRLYRAIYTRRRNRVLCAAHAITTVSSWHAEFIQNLTARRSNSAAVYTIYNGFDDRQFYPEDIPTDTFTITYIGSLFDWQKPALEKVRRVIDELNQSIIENRKSKIEFDLHTPQHNTVPHDRLGDAIRRSGIMLVLTSEQTHGMLTTKFYEALGCEKPILCVPSDKGALADLIAYTHAGIATDGIEAIKTFVLEQYRQWKQNGFTRQHTQHRNEFTRNAQYDKLYNTCL